jgi:DNA-binding transcriptional ArsR family regulator
MDIARERGIAPSTVTYHLDILRRAKLVEIVGRGISRVYRWTSTRLVLATQTELEGAKFSDSNNPQPPAEEPPRASRKSAVVG